MVASVPEETKRTRSTGVRATISSASSTSGSVGVPYDVPRATASVTAACTSGWAWPSSIGPHEQIRSTYSLPSTSVSHAPCADRMKRGVPPTALKARTGEFTPPGVTVRARSKSAADAVVEAVRSGVTRRLSPRVPTGRGAGSPAAPHACFGPLPREARGFVAGTAGHARCHGPLAGKGRAARPDAYRNSGITGSLG